MVLDLLLLVCKIDQKVFDFPAAECCVPISTFLSLKPISIEGLFFFLCLCHNFSGLCFCLLQVNLFLALPHFLLLQGFTKAVVSL